MATREEMLPRKFLNASDVAHEDLTLTITRVVIEEVGPSKDVCRVLYFRETDQKLVLKPTTINNLCDTVDEDSDNWPGRRVILYSGDTTFNGKPTKGLRIKAAPRPKSASKPEPLAKGAVPASDDEPDEIPF